MEALLSVLLFFSSRNYLLRSLNIYLKEGDKDLIEIKNLKFSNYGYKKYQFYGDIFNNKFKSIFNKDNKILNVKLLDTGIKANFKFNENNFENLITGSSKITILNLALILKLFQLLKLMR